MSEYKESLSQSVLVQILPQLLAAMMSWGGLDSGSDAEQAQSEARLLVIVLAKIVELLHFSPRRVWAAPVTLTNGQVFLERCGGDDGSLRFSVSQSLDNEGLRRYLVLVLFRLVQPESCLQEHFDAAQSQVIRGLGNLLFMRHDRKTAAVEMRWK